VCHGRDQIGNNMDAIPETFNPNIGKSAKQLVQACRCKARKVHGISMNPEHEWHRDESAASRSQDPVHFGHGKRRMAKVLEDFDGCDYIVACVGEGQSMGVGNSMAVTWIDVGIAHHGSGQEQRAIRIMASAKDQHVAGKTGEVVAQAVLKQKPVRGWKDAPVNLAWIASHTGRCFQPFVECLKGLHAGA
jgi:hypothetical protein